MLQVFTAEEPGLLHVLPFGEQSHPATCPGLSAATLLGKASELSARRCCDPSTHPRGGFRRPPGNACLPACLPAAVPCRVAALSLKSRPPPAEQPALCLCHSPWCCQEDSACSSEPIVFWTPDTRPPPHPWLPGSPPPLTVTSGLGLLCAPPPVPLSLVCQNPIWLPRPWANATSSRQPAAAVGQS